MTGVDRVEFAYLEHLLDSGPLWGLVRSTLGYVLLDHAGCQTVQARLLDGQWGPADRLARLRKTLHPMRARAEADLRRISVARCLPIRLSHMLRRHLPSGIHYLNTGHTNLTDRVLSALRLRNARVAVFVHDTIPLDFPQYQRPDRIAPFRAFLDRAIANADVILCNSHQTLADLKRHCKTPLPEIGVAHLGVNMPQLGTAPVGPWTSPYFVTLGTIEPRKNHALLLDIWDNIPNAHLLICGNRGWENHAVFARLDAKPNRVHELNALPDDQLFALIKGSAGLLFPSLAEGYGLPPLEAAALEVPVLCNDLPIYREFLGDIPVYADASDGYLWQTTIIQMAKAHQTGTGGTLHYKPPSWAEHFKIVLTLI